jgi:predicted dehydrogenase
LVDIADSGALGDLGAHSIDLAQFLLGSRVERVSGHLRTFVNERSVPGADDSDTLSAAGSDS